MLVENKLESEYMRPVHVLLVKPLGLVSSGTCFTFKITVNASINRRLYWSRGAFQVPNELGGRFTPHYLVGTLLASAPTSRQKQSPRPVPTNTQRLSSTSTCNGRSLPNLHLSVSTRGLAKSARSQSKSSSETTRRGRRCRCCKLNPLRRKWHHVAKFDNGQTFYRSSPRTFFRFSLRVVPTIGQRCEIITDLSSADI